MERISTPVRVDIQLAGSVSADCDSPILSLPADSSLSALRDSLMVAKGAVNDRLSDAVEAEKAAKERGRAGAGKAAVEMPELSTKPEPKKMKSSDD